MKPIMANYEMPQRQERKNLIYETQIKENTLIQMAQKEPQIPNSEMDELSDRTILKGQIKNNNYSSSIQVHATDTIEVSNHFVEATIDPKLTICLILNGKIKGSLDNIDYCLDSSDGPRGYIWALPQPTHWTRHIRKGMKVSKVILSVNYDWALEQSTQNTADADVLAQFLTGNVDIRDWKPSKRAISLAGKIINPPENLPLVQKFQIESYALEILAEALKQLTQEQEMAKSTKPYAPQVGKAETIRNFIENHVQDDLSLEKLSHQLGMSKSAMQKSFKLTFGMTVMDYIRERRLVTARDAMEQDGYTISQAAYLAGYNSPANFATAFKRVFGLSPSDISPD